MMAQRSPHITVLSPNMFFLSFSAWLQWSGDVVAYEEGQDEIDGPKRCREDSHSSPVNLTWLNKTRDIEHEQRWFGWMLWEVSWEVPCDAGMRFFEVSISQKCRDFRPTFGTNSATNIRTGVRWNFPPLSEWKFIIRNGGPMWSVYTEWWINELGLEPGGLEPGACLPLSNLRDWLQEILVDQILWRALGMIQKRQWFDNTS